MNGLWDVVFVLSIATVMLVILDFRIGRAFKGHEVREMQMYAELALTAEGAAGRVIENARQLQVFRAEHNLLKTNVDNLAELLQHHDKRLVIVEERIMRASLMVPHAHRRKDDIDE